MIKLNAKKILFLRDVTLFTFTAFGGAQGHLAIMLKDFVMKRRYISESELLELNAMTMVLPGPSSTQTLVGIAYKVGGLWLSILTFLIWVSPSAAILCGIATMYSFLGAKNEFNEVMTFIQPIAVGIVGSAAITLGLKQLKSKLSLWLAFSAVVATLILKNAFVFPILILLGGIISSAIEDTQEEPNLQSNLFKNINQKKIFYFLGILLLFATLGAIINQTSPFSLPIRLFENFYRNGIIIFGGGQVLVPLMFTEFVEMKEYLTADQFLSGYAFQQILPGPTFSFTSFVGTMAMQNSGSGLGGQIMGSIVATLGINLPGVILVLFFVPFWNDLKKIGSIKRSLSGINAVAVGFVIAAFIFLLQPLLSKSSSNALFDLSIVSATMLILHFTKIRTPWLILAGFLLGLLI
ncbi:chromate efflux transporter [Arcticibacter eurypsychrophilus]|uniref:chromate efflux transporter n=1 Tax=Arcticibacter eurypsychrophilus TaxID=1434752 RepID=UPI00084CF842|nr:chromate efflux transporter [Arcticibacter eurypsychrophilus]